MELPYAIFGDFGYLWTFFYNFSKKKVCAPTRHTYENFPYFWHFFSKVCLMSYTHLWDFLLCTESQMVPKKLAFNLSVLILNIWCFMDVCMGISQKMGFSYTKKQRIFYQIIYLAKNKGFSTKWKNKEMACPVNFWNKKKFQNFSLKNLDFPALCVVVQILFLQILAKIARDCFFF